MNVPVVAPAGIDNVLGTVAAEVLEPCSVTTTPPTGGGPERVTVPVTMVAELPCTEVGVTVRVDGIGAFTVKTAVFVTPPETAVIVTGVSETTGVVLIVNVALEPKLTVTGVTKVAIGLLLDKVTTSPPDGGVAFSVTVPVAARPPGTEAGAIASDETGTVLT